MKKSNLKKILFGTFLATLLAVTASCTGGASSSASSEPAPSQSDGGSESAPEATADGYELALITDVGTIDDKSFNQGSWEGVEQYAKEFGKTYKYYKPAEKADDAYINMIDIAIQGGAKVVVCPGYLFETPIFKVQKQYPDVNFILIDGQPHDENDVADVASNTLAVFFAEEQAGFLAGYAAVTEGYKKLGFMGGIAVPAVVRFGYGFVQGADAAATDLGIAKDEIEIKYTYVGNFDASPENAAKAASWYSSGTEVIFACGGGVGNSVMRSAETAGTKVIGVDVDQSSESTSVITSAMKNLKKSVYDAVGQYYAGSFPGGQTITLNATNKAIELPMETSTFEKFDQAKYDELYGKLVDGSIEVANDKMTTADGKEVENAKDIPTQLVKVDEIQ